MKDIKVWDPLVRLFHWSLVVAFALAWLSADEWQSLHETTGYAVMALIAMRLVWGLIGPHYARFSQFVRPPARALAYLGDLCRGREQRYIGHNPAGALMVLALLSGLTLLTLSGWLYVSNIGGEWLEDLHEFLGNSLLALIALHVAGVVLAGRRHRENLVRAMVHGTKRPPAGDDVV